VDDLNREWRLTGQVRSGRPPCRARISALNLRLGLSLTSESIASERVLARACEISPMELHPLGRLLLAMCDTWQASFAPWQYLVMR
jgi:hypothetical protein